MKAFKSEKYNMFFDEVTGFTARWGKTLKDDPDFCPIGPEIADIEISTICHGVGKCLSTRKPCSFCLPAYELVNTVDGLKPISEIEEGDKVIGYDLNTKQNRVQEVEECYQREYSGDLIEITTEDDKKICLTPEHPVILINGLEKPAGDLREGDEVICIKAAVKIKKINRVNYQGTVHNFHCTPDSLYFVDGILTHNCYKSNTGSGINMSLETFKDVFSKFPKVLTQIAFGIGDIDSNKDLIPILNHCRENEVVPNLTTNGMGVDDEWAQALGHFCGAIAVSHYGFDDICFNAIEKLCGNNLQVNIHKLLSEETFDSCFTLIDKVKSDPRLSKMKAIVFLLLKPKGDRNKFHSIDSLEKYKKLLDYAKEKGVAVGMDSCSAPMALKCVPDSAIPSIEPCESGLFSCFIDVEGNFWPCSFCPGSIDFEPINITKVTDFVKEVWYGAQVSKWRDSLLNSSKGCSSCSKQKHCRSCPVYNITICKENK